MEVETFYTFCDGTVIKKNTNRRGIGQKIKIKINLARFGKLIPTSNEANKVRQADTLLETFEKKTKTV